MSNPKRGDGGAALLRKQNSWSPDTGREEAWARRRASGTVRARGRGQARSVTDDDLDELRGCMDLGFNFEVGCGAWRSRLAETFPALDLYYTVSGGGDGQGSELCACGAGKPPAASDPASEESSIGSPTSILSPGDPPETVKMRLKQWAQVVAWSVHSGN